jgi:hypothetical protein
VIVIEGVWEGVSVCVGVAVEVNDAVGEEVEEGVEVIDGVGVGLEVGVGVKVSVGLGVVVGVTVTRAIFVSSWVGNKVTTVGVFGASVRSLHAATPKTNNPTMTHRQPSIKPMYLH